MCLFWLLTRITVKSSRKYTQKSRLHVSFYYLFFILVCAFDMDMDCKVGSTSRLISENVLRFLFLIFNITYKRLLLLFFFFFNINYKTIILFLLCFFIFKILWFKNVGVFQNRMKNKKNVMKTKSILLWKVVLFFFFFPSHKILKIMWRFCN